MNFTSKSKKTKSKTRSRPLALIFCAKNVRISKSNREKAHFSIGGDQMVTTEFTREELRLSSTDSAKLEIFPSSDYFGNFNQQRDQILGYLSRKHDSVKEAVIDITPSTVWNIHNRNISKDKVYIEVSIPCGSHLMIVYDNKMFYLVNDIKEGDIVMRDGHAHKVPAKV